MDNIKIDYKIVDKPAFKLLAKQVKVNIKNPSEEPPIPKLWKDSRENGSLAYMLEKSAPNVFGYGYIGLCDGSSFDGTSFDAYVGTESSVNSEDGYVTKEMEAAKWAVFSCKGDPNVENVDYFKKIIEVIFPTMGYEPAKYQIEFYPEPEHANKDFEIWFSVNKKESK